MLHYCGRGTPTFLLPFAFTDQYDTKFCHISIKVELGAQGPRGDRMKRLLLAFLLLGVSLFVGCGGSSGGSNPPTTVTLIAISVMPSSPSINVGATQQFAATGTYSDGSTKVLTASANWISVTSSVATVNTSGLVTAVAVGTSNITASSSGVVGSTTLTVANPLVSITVAPPTITLSPPAQQQFTASGKYADGTTQNITSTVTWASSVSTVATINPAGLAVAAAPGITTISATSGTISGNATLTVGAALVSIAVTPATGTVAPNGTQQFTATGAYSDGSHKVITSTVTWAATTGATITASGLATGVTPGATSTITATQNAIVSNPATLTVTNPLVSIAVTPSTASVAPNGTLQFTATGTYADHSTKVITSSVAWKATAGATITAGGLATGVTPNTTSSITATSGTIASPPATLTITNPLVSIAVTPSTASVAPNGTQQFAATGTYADHSTQTITSSVTWSASAGATITAGGLATGITPNSTSTIMAAQGNISGTAVLTITNPLVSIAVTPVTASIAVTFTQQFTAMGTFADHTTSNITSAVTWSSSVPAVATISTLGLASGLTPGTTSITATSGAITSPAATLTVTNATLQSIAVTPASVAIPLANQEQFTAIGTFSDQSTQDITTSVTWTSSDTTKVSIDNVVHIGLATGVAVTTSPVTITATKSPGTPGTASVTVNAANLVSIAITPGTTNLAEGTSRQYTAIGTFSNGSTLNITSQATWSSSDPTNATVTSGLVKALTGNCPTSCRVVITATLGSVNQSLTVDINNVTVNSITVTPIAATIPVGVTQRFNAVATFSDLSTQDVTSNASWNSSNPGVATVNSVGIATSVSSNPNPVIITATFGSVSGFAQLTVNSVTLTNIAITPSQTTFLALGSTVSFQAIGTYSDQSTQNLGNLPAWNSSAPGVVSIGLHTGVAAGVSTGTSNITATYQKVTSNPTQVNVTPALVSIAITPLIGSVPFGVAIPFTAIGTFQNGNTANLTANVTWASSQSSIATISNATGQQGLATGVAPGQTSITAVFAGVVGNATLNVTNATIQSIAITPNNSHAPVGTQVTFTAKGTFIDSNMNTSVVDLSAQVTWASSIATVATINPTSGLANTAGAGVTSISATFTQNGVTVTDTTNLTVP
jgi:trimeric autotransporter adhesin